MRTNSLLLRGTLSSLAITLGLLLYLAVSSSNESITSQQAFTSPIGVVARNTMTEAEQIPIYPEATDVDYTPQDNRAPTRRIVSYTALASPQDVKTYYITELAKTGWSTFEGLGADDTTIEFYWSETDEHGATSVPLLTLAIDMTPSNGKTFVSMWSERLPNSAALPLYPGAQTINYYEEVINSDSGLTQKVTSFLVAADSKTVENYYKNIMTQAGWWFSDHNAGGNEMPGLYFFYYSGGPENGIGGSVSVLVQRQEDGMTQVEIRVRGSL